MNYFCIRCGAEFARLNYYIKHIQKRTLCGATKSTHIPTEDNYIRAPSSHQCTLCDKTFPDSSALQRHYETQQHTELLWRIHLMKMLTEQNEEINGMKMKQEQILAKMDKSLVVTKPDKEPNNFNLNLNLNLHVENLKDTKDYISDDRKYHLLQRGMSAMPFLVKDVNFDPKRPENHNMYISNIKTKTAQVKENGVWVKRDGRKLVSDIIYDYDCKFFREFAENGELGDKYINAPKYYYKYVDITDSKEAQKQIQDEIMEMMYNNREMIIETRKKEEAAIKQRKLLAKQKADSAKALRESSSRTKKESEPINIAEYDSE
jgi:hypothetical protein